MKARFVLLLVLVMALSSSWTQAQEAAPTKGGTRVALVPFASPLTYKPLANRMTRALRQAFRGEVELVEVTGSIMGEALDVCLATPSCVDRVLRGTQSEAILSGTVEPFPEESGMDGARALVIVHAPGWNVSYVEKRCDPIEEEVRLTASLLFAVAKGIEPPGALLTWPTERDIGGRTGSSAPIGVRPSRGGEQASNAAVTARRSDEDWGAVSSGRDSASEGDFREAERAPRGRDDASRRDRSSGIDPGRDSLASFGEDGDGLDDLLAEQRREEVDSSPTIRDIEDDRSQKKRKKKKRRRTSWPLRLSEGGNWRGWSLELQGAGAYGGVNLRATEVVSADSSGNLDGRYRWATRESGTTFEAGIALGRSFGNRFELGLDLGFIPATWSAYYAYHPVSAKDSDVSFEAMGLHTRSSLRGVVFLGVGPRVRPYMGVGATLWVVPALIAPQTTTAYAQSFGPYFHFAVEPAIGTRVLLAKRIYLSIEVRALFDLLDAYLERELGNLGSLSVDELPAVPDSVRYIGTGRLGVGFLF